MPSFRNSCLVRKRHKSFSYRMIKATKDMRTLWGETDTQVSRRTRTGERTCVRTRPGGLHPPALGPALCPQPNTTPGSFQITNFLFSPKWVGFTRKSWHLWLSPDSHMLEGQIEKTDVRNGDCLLGTSLGDAATKMSLMSSKLVTHKLHVPVLWHDVTDSTSAWCWPTFPLIPVPAGHR